MLPGLILEDRSASGLVNRRARFGTVGGATVLLSVPYKTSDCQRAVSLEQIHAEFDIDHFPPTDIDIDDLNSVRAGPTPGVRQEAHGSHQALRHLVHSVHRWHHPPLDSFVRVSWQNKMEKDEFSLLPLLFPTLSSWRFELIRMF